MGNTVPFHGELAWGGGHEVTGETLAGRGHAPCTRRVGPHAAAAAHKARQVMQLLYGPHRSASEVGRVHAFSWVTLTEDQDSLELIQSWKQTPGGQRLGGDLAVAWVGGDLGSWPGHGEPGEALGEQVVGTGFSAEGPEEPQMKQPNRFRPSGRGNPSSNHEGKWGKRKTLASLRAWRSRAVCAEAPRRLTEAKASGRGQHGCRGRLGQEADLSQWPREGCG